MDAVSATIVAGRRDLLNLLNRFDGGVGKIMCKAARRSSGIDSSNPCHWRGERLHHHGEVVGVCLLFVLFVPSCLVVVTRRV